MIESLTLVSLCMLYLVFFRSGKTPPLESPLIIESPGLYKISLAPRLNLAQPFIQSVAQRISRHGNLICDSAPQFFAVRDVQVEAHGSAIYLLVISCKNGLLEFQAIAPQSSVSDSNLPSLSDFYGEVPVDFAKGNFDAGITAAVMVMAAGQGIHIDQLTRP